MDVRSGRIYPSMMEALGAGVPESDIAEILSDDDVPKVRLVVVHSRIAFTSVIQKLVNLLELEKS